MSDIAPGEACPAPATTPPPGSDGGSDATVFQLVMQLISKLRDTFGFGIVLWGGLLYWLYAQGWLPQQQAQRALAAQRAAAAAGQSAGASEDAAAAGEQPKCPMTEVSSCCSRATIVRSMLSLRGVVHMEGGSRGACK